MSQYKRTKKERLEYLKEVDRNTITITVRLNDEELRKLHKLKEFMQEPKDSTVIKHSIEIAANVLQSVFGDKLAANITKQKVLKLPKKLTKTSKMYYNNEDNL